MNQEIDLLLFQQIINEQKTEVEIHLIEQKWSQILGNDCIQTLLLSCIHTDPQHLDPHQTDAHQTDPHDADSSHNQLSSVSLRTQDDEKKMIFYAGVAALQLYVINNHLAACIQQDDHINKCLLFVNHLFDADPDDSLVVDGEQVYSLASNVSLLKLTKRCFSLTKSYFQHLLVFEVWRMRYNVVHQMSLTTSSQTLFEEIKSCAEKIHHLIDANKNNFSTCLPIELYVQMAAAFSLYNDVEAIKCNLLKAQQLADLSICMSGALGVRTQFQQKPLPQLVLNVKRNFNDNEIQNDVESCNKMEPKSEDDFPKNIALNDDTLLPSVKFLSPDGENEKISLYPVEEALILVHVLSSYRVGSPSDELLQEEIRAHLDFLITRSSLWSVRYQTLFIRCLTERESRRRVERSMMQMNELVDVIREKRSCCDVKRRSHLFYAALVNPIWMTEKHLADVLTSLGVNKTALEIYLRLQLWDDVIQCYQRLGRRDKAEEVIRERLAREESPLLYCLLGDVTDNIEYYHKAWILSGQKYPRAQKCLANYYFNLKEYEKSIPYYKKSLELNCMQIDAWFRLAYAAMVLEDYELTASAYRRVVHFETSSFEAWNNLSKAYIKLNQKQRAWKTLQESLKCNYDEWRIWENYIAVCVDVGAFAESIQAWHRLIDIKGKYDDDQIAEILVNAICNETPDFNGVSAAKFASKTQQLFGRISSTSNCSCKFWRLYAKLLSINDENDIEKILQCLQKCHRAAIQDPHWKKNKENIIQVLNHCFLLTDEYQNCVHKINDEVKRKQILSSFKLSLNSIIVGLNNERIVWTQFENSSEIDNLIKECDNKLQSIIDILK